ncbi:Aste57867_1271 [Aphanomyces stellatus]|uniref:Aste57867_1271 protein n=1 Tax=Aphanomyces stellatus TaxID=120398 RepID=A0A485K9W3_9STRA|nr:hypothetical protein As57867_001270 [Aphanomyces stellatus]VFT78490.1 Aste57867_1271 [Aphanomyces stellatus]
MVGRGVSPRVARIDRKVIATPPQCRHRHSTTDDIPNTSPLPPPSALNSTMGIQTLAMTPSFHAFGALREKQQPMSSPSLLMLDHRRGGRRASVSQRSPRADDRKFMSRVNTLRSSLDELSLDLHSTTLNDDDNNVGSMDDDDWGWFADIEGSHSSDDDDNNHHLERRDPSSDVSRVVWRLFPALADLRYEPTFDTCSFPWLTTLPSTDPLPARLEIRHFRVVQSRLGYDVHAEYHVACWIGDAHVESWKRFSAFKRFVLSELKTNGHRRSLHVWKDVLDHSGWFRSLDAAYLHAKCCRLEAFAHTLLLEAPSPYVIARFMASV